MPPPLLNASANAPISDVDAVEFRRLHTRGDSLLKEALKDAMCDHRVPKNIPVQDQAMQQLKVIQGEDVFCRKLEQYGTELYTWHQKVKDQVQDLPRDTPIEFGISHFIGDVERHAKTIIAQDNVQRAQAQRPRASGPQAVSASRAANVIPIR